MGDLSDLISELGSKQRDRRLKGFFIDQLDRRYFAWADKDNMRPIGEFVLADKTGRFVTAPWNPPMRYISWADRYSIDFVWTFGALAEELAGFAADWYSLAQQLAESAKIEIPEIGGEVHPKLIGLMGPPPLSPEVPLAAEAGERWIIGVRGAPVNARLSKLINQGKSITSTMAMDEIRERVRIMIEMQDAGEPIPEDMKDLSTIKDPVIEVPDFASGSGAFKFDPAALTYKEFMASAMKQGGMGMAQAASAWAAHKRNLSEAAAG